jgi:hypothetical protein
MGEAYEAEFATLEVATPCCGEAMSLNDLRYDWPAGFAHASLTVAEPQREWLDETELAQVAADLGHPVRQVMVHY